ncbi:D-alanyl-lipoteichoic acid biosynthesis protein DltD, partial [Bacillus pumilus]|uniref:D-alanyl-lipoteichoic acid biosynthesis protein DltD n=1 Tax=Bacillus pumilus TaxID=1408 RepID=UPI0028CB5901
PLNTKSYHYTPFPKHAPTHYYHKINPQIPHNRYQLAHFTNHHYHPYFFKHTIHLSYKGCVYIDKPIEKFYTQQ